MWAATLPSSLSLFVATLDFPPSPLLGKSRLQNTPARFSVYLGLASRYSSKLGLQAMHGLRSIAPSLFRLKSRMVPLLFSRRDFGWSASPSQTCSSVHREAPVESYPPTEYCSATGRRELRGSPWFNITLQIGMHDIFQWFDCARWSMRAQVPLLLALTRERTCVATGIVSNEFF